MTIAVFIIDNWIKVCLYCWFVVLCQCFTCSCYFFTSMLYEMYGTTLVECLVIKDAVYTGYTLHCCNYYSLKKIWGEKRNSWTNYFLFTSSHRSTSCRELSPLTLLLMLFFIKVLLWMRNTLQYYANFIACGKTTLMQHEFCLFRFVWKVTLPVGRQLWCNILKNTQQCILFQSRSRSGLIWMATMLWWINTFLKC